MLSSHVNKENTMASRNGFAPARVIQIDIDQPLQPIMTLNEANGREYHRALALIRLHTQPLGVVELRWEGVRLDPVACAEQVWRALGPTIRNHLRQDGLAVTSLDARGVPSVRGAPCLHPPSDWREAAPFMSVVVPTRDRPDRLRACLQSLLALDYPDYEIIVVDNAPRTRATASLLQELQGGRVPLRYLCEERPGVSWARNFGLGNARGEFVAFTDDDVLVDKNWLSALAAGFRAADNVACVTGLILPLELETQAQEWFEEYGGFTRGFAQTIYDMKEYRPGRDTPNGRLYPFSAGIFGVGANNAFRAATLCELGGYDPALGGGTASMGGEELAEYFKLLTHGFRLVYQPAALVYHAHRREYTDLRRQIYAYGLGFSAYITKSLVDNPRLILDILSRLPYAVYRILAPGAPKHRQKRQDFPRELTRLELIGMMLGPLAYLRARWQVHQTLRRFGPFSFHTTSAARGAQSR